MQKNEIQLMEDPYTKSKLSIAIILAYGILLTGLMAFVGVFYLFSQMVNKFGL